VEFYGTLSLIFFFLKKKKKTLEGCKQLNLAVNHQGRSDFAAKHQGVVRSRRKIPNGSWISLQTPRDNRIMPQIPRDGRISLQNTKGWSYFTIKYKSQHKKINKSAGSKIGVNLYL
jgi:hypothetical protein